MARYDGAALDVKEKPSSWCGWCCDVGDFAEKFFPPELEQTSQRPKLHTSVENIPLQTGDAAMVASRP